MPTESTNNDTIVWSRISGRVSHKPVDLYQSFLPNRRIRPQHQQQQQQQQHHQCSSAQHQLNTQRNRDHSVIRKKSNHQNTNKVSADPTPKSTRRLANVNKNHLNSKNTNGVGNKQSSPSDKLDGAALKSSKSKTDLDSSNHQLQSSASAKGLSSVKKGKTGKTNKSLSDNSDRPLDDLNQSKKSTHKSVKSSQSLKLLKPSQLHQSKSIEKPSKSSKSNQFNRLDSNTAQSLIAKSKSRVSKNHETKFQKSSSNALNSKQNKQLKRKKFDQQLDQELNSVSTEQILSNKKRQKLSLNSKKNHRSIVNYANATIYNPNQWVQCGYSICQKWRRLSHLSFRNEEINQTQQQNDKIVRPPIKTSQLTEPSSLFTTISENNKKLTKIIDMDLIDPKFPFLPESMQYPFLTISDFVQMPFYCHMNPDVKYNRCTIKEQQMSKGEETLTDVDEQE